MMLRNERLRLLSDLGENPAWSCQQISLIVLWDRSDLLGVSEKSELFLANLDRATTELYNKSVHSSS